MTERRQNLRQKSCQGCAAAKVRCNLKRPTCSRCTIRKATCQWATPSKLENLNEPPSTDGGVTTVLSTGFPTEQRDPTPPEGNQLTFDISDHTESISTIPCHLLDDPLNSLCLHTNVYDGSLPTGSGSELMQVLNANAFAALPSPATTPTLAKHSMELVLRILRTWPSKLAKGIELPPVVHSSQTEGVRPILLGNCLTIVNMWYGQYVGASDFVQATVLREVEEIIRDVNLPSYPSCYKFGS
jgi:hypothetical protein